MIRNVKIRGPAHGPGMARARRPLEIPLAVPARDAHNAAAEAAAILARAKPPGAGPNQPEQGVQAVAGSALRRRGSTRQHL